MGFRRLSPGSTHPTPLFRAGLGSLDGVPDAFGGGGHVEAADAVFGEGVDDGVHDRGEGAGAAGFAAAFGAQRVGFGGHRVAGAGEKRGVLGGDDRRRQSRLLRGEN